MTLMTNQAYVRKLPRSPQSMGFGELSSGQAHVYQEGDQYQVHGDRTLELAFLQSLAVGMSTFDCSSVLLFEKCTSLNNW